MIIFMRLHRLPGGSYGKESACNAGDLVSMFQYLGQDDPLEKGMATQPSILPGKSHGQRNLAGYGPWDCKELDTLSN